MIDVVGIGLDGAAGLAPGVLRVVENAVLLVGSDRHLSYFPNHPGERLVLGDLKLGLQKLRRRLEAAPEEESIVVLTSGDPLFFGLGRLLVSQLPPENLTFHPHLSSVQLAFNRIKVPWQDARVISAHGRSLDEAIEALRGGENQIAVLTDDRNHPGAIARALLGLDLPNSYQFWVCENLGGSDERVECYSDIAAVTNRSFAPLNVVLLIREAAKTPDVSALPLLGLPDASFVTFDDRPNLLTKREIRLLVLGELQLQPAQTVWDIGAGTGTVAIEIARLCPKSTVYAIEKTAAGTGLIEQNCQRLQVRNVISIYGEAPEILYRLPAPDRIFIGGSGGKLRPMLGVCDRQLTKNGVIVLAISTIEHLNIAITWAEEWNWQYRLLQVNLSRSVPVAHLTRFAPLNPVTILTLSK